MLWFVLGGLAWAGSVPTKRPLDPEAGRQFYARDCVPCHGERALGDGPADAALPGDAPPLAGRVPKARWPELVAVIQQGRGGMPGYAAILGEEDSERVLVWLATLDPETGLDPDKPSKASAASKKARPKKPADEDQSDEVEPAGAEGDEGARVGEDAPDAEADGGD